MRLIVAICAALLATACSPNIPDEVMFIRKDAPRVEGDIGPLLLDDALSRLTPDKRAHLERLGQVAGFHFEGRKYQCIVIVTLRADVINHDPAPAFCYDKSTNEFVGQL